MKHFYISMLTVWTSFGIFPSHAEDSVIANCPPTTASDLQAKSLVQGVCVVLQKIAEGDEPPKRDFKKKRRKSIVRYSETKVIDDGIAFTAQSSDTEILFHTITGIEAGKQRVVATNRDKAIKKDGKKRRSAAAYDGTRIEEVIVEVTFEGLAEDDEVTLRSYTPKGAPLQIFKLKNGVNKISISPAKGVDKVDLKILSKGSSDFGIRYSVKLKYESATPGVALNPNGQAWALKEVCEPEPTQYPSDAEVSIYYEAVAKGISNVEAEENPEKKKEEEKPLKPKKLPKEFQSLYVEFVGNEANYLDPAAAQSALASFAQYLKSNPDKKIELIGVTDSNLNPAAHIIVELMSGDVPFANVLQLSRSRAEQVKRSLVDLGVNPDQIVRTRGSWPGTRLRLYTYALPLRKLLGIGIKQNRRIDVKIVDE